MKCRASNMKNSIKSLMEKSNASSAMEPDSLPPSYASVMQSVSHDQVFTPLVSSVEHQPAVPMPMPYAAYSMPTDARPGDSKPAQRLGHNSTCTSAFPHDAEADIGDEMADYGLQRRASSDLRKCCIIVVALLVCGALAVMVINLCSKQRKFHLF